MAYLLSTPTRTHLVYFLERLEGVFHCMHCLRLVALVCSVLAVVISAVASFGDGCKISLASQTRFVFMRDASCSSANINIPDCLAIDWFGQLEI
jgi:hypothetical protein